MKPTNTDHRRFSFGTILMFLLLLVLPVLALLKQLLNPIFLVGFAALSLITWTLYWHDKKRAQADGWRVPESILHLLEIVGGWPIALLAQRYFRHKTSKKSYQVIFWLIIILHQFIALDSLQHWKFTSALLSTTQSRHSP